MDSLESISNNESSSKWLSWFKDLKKQNTILGGIARSCIGSDSISNEEDIGKISFIWDSRCSEKTIECLNTGAPLTCVKAFSLCSGVEALIDRSKLIQHVTTGTENTIHLTKNSIKALSSNFFSLCHLPPLPKIENSQCLSLDWKSIAIIGGAWLFLPHAINYLYENKTSKESETILAKSVGKGLIIGPIMAWTFNQNLYLGAITGILSAWTIDTISSYTLKPVYDLLTKILEKDHIKKTFERQKTIIQYGATVAALSICYAQAPAAIPFSDDSFYNFIKLPISITLATGTFIFILKYPVTLLEGIYDSTKDAIKTVGSSPEMPLIAYSSLYLTLHSNSIVDFAKNNFPFESCLKLYTDISRSLLTPWEKVGSFDFYKQNKTPLLAITILGILATTMYTCYKLLDNSGTKKLIKPTLTSPFSQQNTSAFTPITSNHTPPSSQGNFPKYTRKSESPVFNDGL